MASKVSFTSKAHIVPLSLTTYTNRSNGRNCSFDYIYDFIDYNIPGIPEINILPIIIVPTINTTGFFGSGPCSGKISLCSTCPCYFCTNIQILCTANIEIYTYLRFS